MCYWKRGAERARGKVLALQPRHLPGCNGCDFVQAVRARLFLPNGCFGATTLPCWDLLQLDESAERRRVHALRAGQLVLNRLD